MVKLLYWDSDGLAIWNKHLEKGSFIIPRMRATDGSIEHRELNLLLEGVVLKKVTQRYTVSGVTSSLLIIVLSDPACTSLSPHYEQIFHATPDKGRPQERRLFLQAITAPSGR